MKLLLRRGERKGAFGNIIYTLAVRAEFTPSELAAIAKHKYGPRMLYSRKGAPDGDPTSLAGIGAILLHRALDTTVSVGDLIGGKTVECKDMVQMLSAETGIRAEAVNFAAILRASSQFGGEEVIEL